MITLNKTKTDKLNGFYKANTVNELEYKKTHPEKNE